MKKNVRNLKEMEDFAESLYRDHISHLKKDSATIVFLFGDLGSGKTTFTRLLAGALGISSRVTSPTFVIEKRYKIVSQVIPFKTLIHIDAYRLKGENIDVLDIENDIKNPNNIICIEWPENITLADFSPDVTLSFTFVDENTRSVEVS